MACPCRVSTMSMIFFQFSSYSRTARTARVHAYWPGQTVFEILYFTKTGPEQPDNTIKRVYVTCVSFLPKSLDILDFVQSGIHYCGWSTMGGLNSMFFYIFHLEKKLKVGEIIFLPL